MLYAVNLQVFNQELRSVSMRILWRSTALKHTR
jgi:hypothetical protein